LFLLEGPIGDLAQLCEQGWPVLGPFALHQLKKSQAKSVPEVLGWLVDLWLGSMRFTHKKTVISHKLCTHFWSSKLSHKKEKKDKTEWFTHRFSK
jgi:hypothetical protein